MPEKRIKYRVGAFVAHDDSAEGHLFRPSVESVFNAALDFWKETTGGFIDTSGSRLLPDLSQDVVISISKVDPTGEDILKVAYDELLATLKTQNHNVIDPLNEFDVLLAFIYPGVFEFTNPEFATNRAVRPTVKRPFRSEALANGTDGKLVGVIATKQATFSTICHELGHCFGFVHPRGLTSSADDDLATNAVEISDEYGSPYDIMGVWGQNSVTDAVPAWTYVSSHVLPPDNWPQDWPLTVGQAVGPNLSRAQLHFRWPEAIHAENANIPTGADTATATVRAPRFGDAGSILVLHPTPDSPSKLGRLVIEYRTAQAADSGLAEAPGDFAHEGVVVHQFAARADGDVRPYFRGLIRREGVDADLFLATPSGGLTITVNQWSDDTANVTVSVNNTPRCTVTTFDPSSKLVRLLDGVTKTTPCGDNYIIGTWRTALTVHYAARVIGFGGSGEFMQSPPSVTWSIGEVELSGMAGAVSVPVGGSAVVVSYVVDQQTSRLTAVTSVGDQYDIDVTATVVGSVTPVIQGSSRLKPSGTFSGIDPGALRFITRCIEKNIPVPADLWEFKRPPRLVDADVINPELERLRPQWVEHRLFALANDPGIVGRSREVLVELVKAQGQP